MPSCRRMVSGFVAGLAVLLGTGPLAPAAGPGMGPVPLQKGEKILFLGDSITQAGADPGGYISLIKQALNERHGDLRVKVAGSGTAGHKVSDLQKRLERDVLSRQPSLVVILIGINDAVQGENNLAQATTRDKFQAGLTDVVTRVQKAGARVILCTPSVIGEKKGQGNYLDPKLEDYSEAARRVAKQTECELCDLRKAFKSYLEKNNRHNETQGLLTTDRVHLSADGNRLVADALLKHLSP